MGIMKELSIGNYSKKLKKAYSNPQAMVGISVDMFFHTGKLTEVLDAMERDALKSAGAQIRSVAQRSMRKTADPNKSSEPGQPPRAHEGRLRRSIMFGYDPDMGTVVIGPAEFMGRAEVPALHEFGGIKSTKKMIDPRVIYVGKHYQFFKGRIPFRIKSMSEARAIANFYNRKQKMRSGKLNRPYVAAESPREFGGKRSVYAPRPYMEPALVAMMPKIQDQFPKYFRDAWSSPL